MDVLSLIFLAFGLAMDAFAVSVATGLKIPAIEKWKIALKAGLFFGVAQGVMPIIGWALGTNFKEYIESFDHWIAFGLLVFIGGKMVYEALNGDEDEEEVDTGTKRMFILAIATSIDALAVGVSFAFLDVNIILAALLIGVITLATSSLGVIIGKVFGDLFKGKAELVGGLILIFIGVKILIEHTGIISKIMGIF